jgi:putative hydrolase of the HAD superfamily
MPTHLRAVLFDAVGTVLYPDPAAPAAYYAAGRRFGSQLTVLEVTRRYEAAFRRQEAIDQHSGQGRTDEAREERRWRAIVADVFADVPDVDGLFRHLWHHFASPSNWGVFADVAGTWRALEQQGLTLGLASNFDARLVSVCQGFEPLAGCDKLFISSRLGARKPHPGFFAAIQTALGLEPGEIMLVGDSLQHDYHAALAAGWQAVHVCRDGAGSEAVGSICDLAELLPPTRGGERVRGDQLHSEREKRP